MSTEGKGSKFWVLAAGAAAVVGAAVVYHLATSSGEGSEEAKDEDELRAEMEKLGDVGKDPNGTIKLQDFMSLFKLITKHAKKRISKVKRSFSVQRRETLRKGLEDEYRSHVQTQMQEEEAIYQEIANEVMSYFGIEEQEFMMSQQVHMMNPQFQQTMMAMQMGMDDEDKDWKPEISREKSVEIFKFMEELKMKTMEKLSKGPGAGGMDQMEATIQMLVEHSKVGDMIFEKFQIEEEEVTKCIKHFELMKDPEIIRMMQENIEKLGPEAKAAMAGAMGGGMGGGPPGMGPM